MKIRNSRLCKCSLLSAGLVLVIAASLLAGAEASMVPVGRTDIRGGKIKPFKATWYQRTRASADAEWNEIGTITESVREGKEGGRSVLIREQITENKQRGIKTVSTVVFDARNLLPLRWSFERTGENLPDRAPVKGGVEYDGTKVKGEIATASGQKVPIEAESSVPMYDAGVLGLIIASLPLKEGYEIELPALFQGRQKYMIRARVVGRKEFKTGSGAMVNSWAVKTDWKGLDSNDPYPDDESGGTFYVVPDPPGGFPMVPKYINPNFDTQVIP